MISDFKVVSLTKRNQESDTFEGSGSVVKMLWIRLTQCDGTCDILKASLAGMIPFCSYFTVSVTDCLDYVF